MSENHAPDTGPNLLTSLHRIFVVDERRRFILLFLVINLLILLLLWLSWQNQTLIQEKRVLQTQLALGETRVVDCEVDCTDKMSTVAARRGTAVAQVAATLGAFIIPSPVPSTLTATPTTTPILANTFTPTPTPSDTSTPMPTDTRTPTPTGTPTPKPKPPDVSTPYPPPEVSGMTPTITVRNTTGPPFPVAVTGQNFRSGITVRLGADTWISVTGSTSATISGELSPNMPIAVYGLTVTNPDGQSGIHSPAFTVHDSYGITIPLESPYLVTFGKDVTSPYDVGYQEQLIFFEVPVDLSENLYVRILDADTGPPSSLDTDPEEDGYGTEIRYTLYGLTGTHAAWTPFTTVTMGISNTWDYKWYPLGPFNPQKWDPVGDRRIFKLAVQGLGGNDANWYRVALSTQHTSPEGSNSVPRDLRMFALSYVLPLSNETERPYLHPYVRSEMANFQWELSGPIYTDGNLLFRTPFRNPEAVWSEEERRFTPAGFLVRGYEDEATWAVDFSGYIIPEGETDYVVFRARDENDQALFIFTRPTIRTPSLAFDSMHSSKPYFTSHQ